MRTTGLIIALCGSFLLLEGCKHNGTPTSPPTVSRSLVASSFERRIRDRGSITFRSWNGQALRSDSDTELTFFPDHSVQMWDYGVSLTGYWGTYHIHDDGCVVARFRKFQSAWPVMIAYDEGDTLILRPWDPAAESMKESRWPATMPNAKSGYWPFRMLTGDDEKNVLDLIKQRAGPSLE